MTRGRSSGIRTAPAARFVPGSAACLAVVSSLLVSLLALSAEPAAAQVATDGSVGPAVELTGPEFVIPGDLGTQSGGTLFHSFDRFDLSTGTAAKFTGDGLGPVPVDLIVSRVTGGPSSIDGSIVSEVGEQHFLFVNPFGVVFGANARISVPGSFHVTTADQVEFADGSTYSARAPGPAPLTTAPVSAYGFLGADVPAPITVRGWLEVGKQADITLVGGNLELEGPGVESDAPEGLISAVEGSVGLVALGSGGRVTGVLGPVDGLDIEGAKTRRGDIRLRDNFTVTASTLSPIYSSPTPGDRVPPEQLSGTFKAVDGGTERIANVRLNLAAPGENDVLLGQDSAGTRFYLVPVPSGAAPSGSVRILGHDLTLVDSEVSSQTAGDGAAGGIDIDLDGDLTMQRVARSTDVGLISRSGIEVVGGQTVFSTADGLLRFDDVRLRVVGAGDAGPISIDARDIDVSGGALVTATSLGAGKGGDIDIAASRDVVLDGFAQDGERTALFASAQGSGDAGDIRIGGARLLSLTDGGGIINQTTRNGDGGTITIDVGRIEVRANGQIDSSTSGTGGRPEDGAATTGLGGTLDIRASRSITIAGDPLGPSDTRISSFSGRDSEGQAGNVTLTTPLLEISDGGAILATTRGAGDGGGVRLDVGTLRLTRGSVVAAASEASIADLGGRLPGDAGSIEVGLADAASGRVHALESVLVSSSRVTSEAVQGPSPPTDPAQTELEREGNITFRVLDRLDIRDDSRIEASVGEGLGGSIRISDPDGVILRDTSAILAQARGTGQGGRIEITTDVLIESASSLINADAGQGLDGEVIINSPVTQVEGQTPPLQASFLDPSSLMRSVCEARAAGEGGSLRVAASVGLPPSIRHYLRAPSGGLEDEPSSGELAFRAGRYEDAATEFARLEREAARDRRDPDRVRALIGLADTRLALGQPERARASLDEADRLLGDAGSRNAESPLLEAVIASQRASLAFYEDELSSAAAGYERAAVIASGIGAIDVEAVARANAVRVAAAMGTLDEAPARLGWAASLAAAASDDVGWSTSVHVADTAAALVHGGALGPAEVVELRLAALQAAWQATLRTDDARGRANVLGRLGDLYAEEDGRSDDALRLYERALREAEQARSKALEATWTAHRAALLAARGERAGALDGWRRAARLLDEERPEALPRYGRRLSLLAEDSRPVYLGLADSLLRSADGVDASLEIARLHEARATMERYRAVELRDYFEDACIADLHTRTQGLDEILDESGEGVAVVYPVVLPDRLELIVSLPGEIERFVVDVDERTLQANVRAFRSLLETRTSRRYLGPAQRLHDWIIAPMQASLTRAGVDTLVFVPGPLFRGVPMAALHDGQSFLVERYALGLTPGLSLVDARPVALDRSQILLAGLSESVEGFPALPGVRRELAAIQAMQGGDLLLDGDFAEARFTRRLEDDEPAIVHLASHAVFTGRLGSSFVLSAGGRIGFDDLGRILRQTQFREQPVELLVLSACETSSGNDRASMGLTGLAVRAGARSAMGSLWSISDVATYELIVGFYRELARPGISKAEALRRAQIDLIARPEFAHPYYWSPMLLVSNWM